MNNKIKVYLVGGAVRDQLLNLVVKDRDWVVVGATPDDLLAQGYQRVGKDFPVFLHPQTKEEYALARTEKKTGSGYTGFICDFSPTISLEQDLSRRDLTINALAQDLDGKIYDFYGGRADLHQRLLRHVSPAFTEDPLRVLRVARFAARYHALGFTIAPETRELMQQLSQSGELSHLTPERVWLETEKALLTAHPEVYFQTLYEVGALQVLFPELAALHGVPNPAKYHPEIDTFVHTMLVLQQAVQLTESEEEYKSAVRFAAICHDLGKALTPKQIWPHHYGHEKAGVRPTRSLCQRFKLPHAIQAFAELCCEYHSHIHKAFELRPDTLLKLFNRLDVWRKPERFKALLLVCLADSRGRTGFEHTDYPQREFVWQLYQSALTVNVQDIIQQGFQQQAIREELNRQRTRAIQQARDKRLACFTNSH
ncbi:multifunctional CCA addition/repair protein [Bisgaard Taxon 45]